MKSGHKVIQVLRPPTSVGSRTDEDLNRRRIDIEERQGEEMETQILLKVNTGSNLQDNNTWRK